MAKQSEVHIDLNDLNHSELVALARFNGFDYASRAWPREALIEALSAFEDPELNNPLDNKRERLSTWLKSKWAKIQMQAYKSACPECFLCRDSQVLQCYNKNKRHFES